MKFQCQFINLEQPTIYTVVWQMSNKLVNIITTPAKDNIKFIRKISSTYNQYDQKIFHKHQLY